MVYGIGGRILFVDASNKEDEVGKKLLTCFLWINDLIILANVFSFL